MTAITIGLTATAALLLCLGVVVVWFAPTGRTNRPVLTGAVSITLGAVFTTVAAVAARLPANLATATALTIATGVALVARGLFGLRARARTRRMHAAYTPAYQRRAHALSAPLPAIEAPRPALPAASSEAGEC